MTTFDDLNLIAPLRRAIADQNYERPTPVQAQAIPPLLEGRDVLGCAQTGTGKTAAFALPVLQHMSEATRIGKAHIRALVLTPTRELAAQISDSFEAYGKYLDISHLVIFGGVNENPQIRALRKGVDVLVATPGRLLDLLGRGFIDLSEVDFFVLDEADRMLDMGFVHDVRRVLQHLPSDKQNLLFSATMPKAIVQLAGSFLHQPVHVEVTPQSTTVERIDQTVMFVERADKKRLLAQLLRGSDVDRSIVFTRTKHGANRLAQQLSRVDIHAAAIHGNKSQSARNRALSGFRDGSIRVLIATDIASRGIDIDGVSHVFNYDLPNIPESYVHRIGRTGRAGRSGIAVSFCDDTEGEYLRDIERLIGAAVPVVDDHEFHSAKAVPPAASARRSGNRKPSGGRQNQSRRSQGRRAQKQRSPQGGEPRDSVSRQAGSTDRQADGAADRQAGGARTPNSTRPQRTENSDRPRRRRRPRPGAAPARNSDQSRGSRGSEYRGSRGDSAGPSAPAKSSRTSPGGPDGGRPPRRRRVRRRPRS